MAEPKVSVLLQLVDKFTQPVEGVRGSLSKLKGSLGALGTAVAAAFTTAALGKFFKDSIEEGLKAEKTYFRLQQAVENVGGSFAATKPAIDRAVDSVVRMSTFTDDDLSEALSRLITMTGDVNGSMENLGLVADIAAYKQISVQDAAVLLGKALNGNTRIMKEFGIQGGTASERIEELRARVGGFAEREANTMGGKLQNLNRDWGEFKEKIGLAIIGSTEAGGAVSGLAGMLVRLNEWTEKNSDTIQRFSGYVFGAIEVVGKLVGFLVEHSVQYAMAIGGLARDAIGFFVELPAQFQLMWGNFLKVVGSSLAESRVLMTIFGDRLTEVAERVANSGVAITQDAHRRLREIRRDDDAVAATSQRTQTDALRAGITQRTALSEAEVKANQKREKEAGEALARLKRDAMLASMTALGREMIELKEQLDKALLASEASARDEAVAVHRDRVAQVLAAHAKLDELKPRMERTHQAMLQITTDWGDQTVPVVRAVWEEYDLLLNSISEVAGEAEEAADTILDFAKEAGIANEEVVNLVGGVANLADGLKQITGATDFAGLLGGIGTMVAGLQGVLGALFGDSPAEKARKELLRKNTTALERLRDQIGDLMQAQSSGATIAKFQALDLSVLAGGGDSKADNLSRLSGLGQMLRANGLTVSDFETMLADLGIDLGDWRKNGISTGQLAQIIQGLKTFEPAQFDQSFGGQQDFLQRYFNVAGIDDPALQAEFAKTTLKGKNDFLANLIGQFDLATAEGRAGLQEAFAQVFQQLNNGTFNVGNFGQLTGSEFVEFIEYFTDLLGQMGGTAGTVTGGGGTGATYGTSAPAPVTIAAESATVLTEIATNTGLTVEELRAIRALIETGNLGTTTVIVDGVTATGDPMQAERLSEALATLVDLTTANAGAA